MINRMIRPGECGVINEKQPKAPTKLGLDEKHCTAKLKGIGSGFARGWLNINP